jgi:hypothetical protein
VQTRNENSKKEREDVGRLMVIRGQLSPSTFFVIIDIWLVGLVLFSRLPMMMTPLKIDIKSLNDT